MILNIIEPTDEADVSFMARILNWYDLTWFDLIRCDMIWFGLMGFDLIWYDLISLDVIWFDMIWFH
jgi:hypothetical protein